MFAGKECGSILYDSKNHNQFRNEHVSKLKADHLAAKAEHAILSTYKFRRSLANSISRMECYLRPRGR
jgi:hypothetical protein